jgi:hypothetical protein
LEWLVAVWAYAALFCCRSPIFRETDSKLKLRLPV